MKKLDSTMAQQVAQARRPAARGDPGGPDRPSDGRTRHAACDASSTISDFHPWIAELQWEISMYHGKRVAVMFRVGDNAHVVCGMGICEEDRDLGPVLRVELEQDDHDLAGQTALIFREESLQGRLDVDDRYGCDLCVDLGRMTTRHDVRPKGGQRKVARELVASA